MSLPKIEEVNNQETYVLAATEMLSRLRSLTQQNESLLPISVSIADDNIRAATYYYDFRGGKMEHHTTHDHIILNVLDSRLGQHLFSWKTLDINLTSFKVSSSSSNVKT